MKQSHQQTITFESHQQTNHQQSQLFKKKT